MKLKRTVIKVTVTVICILLTLIMSGCGKTEAPEPNSSKIPTSSTETEKKTDTEVTVMGEGNTVFEFAVVDADGTQTDFEIHTDKSIVGDALRELGLIDGDEGQYGLYVKTVNSVTYDYDKDGKYWAFYIDGEYASSGVDTTDIVPGSVYSFKADKGEII